MKAFLPGSLREAVEIRKKHGACVISGGTDFMVKNKKFDSPVVYIGKLRELKGIKFSDTYLRIGAATTLSELLESPLIPTIFKDIIEQMAAPAIRNIATIGGNVCNASPAGDTLPYLYAVDAKLVIAGPVGERSVPVENFIRGPGKTDLGEDEILKEILIPENSTGEFSLQFYRKVGTRRANALSKLSFIGLWRPGDLRVAFGAVAPTVVRDRGAEQAFVSRIASIDQVITMYEQKIKPIDDQRSTAHYRRTVAIRLLKYFLNRIEEVRGGFS